MKLTENAVLLKLFQWNVSIVAVSKCSSGPLSSLCVCKWNKLYWQMWLLLLGSSEEKWNKAENSYYCGCNVWRGTTTRLQMASNVWRQPGLAATKRLLYSSWQPVINANLSLLIVTDTEATVTWNEENILQSILWYNHYSVCHCCVCGDMKF